MKPSIRAFERFAKITLHRYERYLPTAFDESLTLLEKMNKLIEYLNQMGIQLNDVVEQWNEVMEWIISDGINDVVLDRLDEMVQDGTLESLINETVLVNLNNKVDTISNELSSQLDDVSDDVADILDRYVTESVELLVPSQFPSIISAINYATSKHNTANIVFRVIVESGHEITSPTSLSNGDYSHITLSSQDDVVYVSSGFNTSNNVFQFTNATAPTFNMLVDGGGNCRMGVAVTNNSSIRFTSGSGFINAGDNNLYVRNGSRANATYGKFTGAGKDQNSSDSAGITAWGSSNVSAYGADVSNSRHYGVRSAHGSNVEFDNGKATDCGYHNIRATQGATLNCRNSDARRAGIHGIYALDASMIHADNSDVSGTTQYGFFASGGSTIQASGSKANECGINGARARDGSTLSISSLEANDCGGNALDVFGASTVYARNGQFNDSSGFGVRVGEHSYVHIQNSGISRSLLGGVYVTGMSNVSANVCTITSSQPGNANAHGVNVQGMSTVAVNSCLIYLNGGRDIRIEGGSRVSANNTRTTATRNAEVREPHLDDTNVSNFNTQTSFGVVYK